MITTRLVGYEGQCGRLAADRTIQTTKSERLFDELGDCSLFWLGGRGRMP